MHGHMNVRFVYTYCISLLVESRGQVFAESMCHSNRAGNCLCYFLDFIVSLNVIVGQLLKCAVVVLRTPEWILEIFSGVFFCLFIGFL